MDCSSETGLAFARSRTSFKLPRLARTRPVGTPKSNRQAISSTPAAGLLLSGRIGAGIGAELGAMKVTEQIDALEATAVDSFRFLVVTRVVACVIALPILTSLMNFTGMLGGFAAETAITGTPLQTYFRQAFSSIEFSDLIPATLKTAVFGFIIASVASYLGINTTRGTEGVGQAATRSVVLASILLIAANVLLVRLIFFFYPA
jgi:phospholipid/cholesterol/gamma-HCH transport system permease protein